MTVTEYNKSVDQYSDKVYRFILSNIRDEEIARDVVQDSFEKLWINHKKVDNEKCRSYLFTTVYHRMIDIIRKSKHDSDMEIQEEYHPTDQEQYSDLNEVLHNALNSLSEIQRSVVLLRDYEGYSYKEIAGITELTESQVKVYIYRARHHLRNFIGSLETVV